MCEGWNELPWNNILVKFNSAAVNFYLNCGSKLKTHILLQAQLNKDDSKN